MSNSEPVVVTDSIGTIDMGTAEQARHALITNAAAWRAFRQPVMGSRATHREHQAREREALFQLGNAAVLWLWHEEHAMRAATSSADARDGTEREARSELPSPAEASGAGWRTIDSAPKDGTLILLYEDCEPACVQIGRWEEDGQCWAADPGGWSVEVAMWQPLPSPPSLNQEGKRG